MDVCEWTPEAHNLGDGKKPVKGEIWFDFNEAHFAIAGFWQHTGRRLGFAMVTCDPNELVAPIHSKAMITILHESDWNTWLQGPTTTCSRCRSRIRLNG
jgi:putative SOS response-associated peptidase YedK